MIGAYLVQVMKWPTKIIDSSRMWGIHEFFIEPHAFVFKVLVLEGNSHIREACISVIQMLDSSCKGPS